MDKYYMKMALELAKKGLGKVNPNPLVGAVIVRDRTIIGTGYHEKYSENHAEINALKDAKGQVEGATLYVTLEPCSHHGSTPPCVDRILQSKISRVVIGMKDPNPLVAGKGIEKLQRAGIDVTVGVLEPECRKINEVFIKYISTKKPFVVLKIGMSLDGKIATHSGESKWITGVEARQDVHKLRNSLMGIMVGIDTIIYDNPQLTCRLQGGRNPVRIIIDSHLRIPKDAQVLEDVKHIQTIIATTESACYEKSAYLIDRGIVVIRLPSAKGRVDLKQLMKQLGELSIDSILLEGGSTLNDAALEASIVDKFMIYIAPKIIGGKQSKTPVGGKGIDKLKDAYRIKDISTIRLGEDILFEGYLRGVEE